MSRRRYGLPFFLIVITLGCIIVGPTAFQKFCYNLGNVFRNHAILVEMPQTQRDRMVRLALQWFVQGGRDEVNTLLGISFKTHHVLDLASEQHNLSPLTSITWLVEKTLQYREVLEITNIGSLADTSKWTLVTATSNSTRIEQGSLLGFVFMATRNGEVHIRPIRAGIDVAEWAYDFPDILPRHLKPAVQILLPAGGLGYPLCWTTAAGDSVDRIAIAFLYPQAWHVAPGWKIIELSATDEDRCSIEK